MCSGRIQLPLYRERTYGKNRRITVKNLFEKDANGFHLRIALGLLLASD